MASATGLILLDRDGVLNALVPNPAEPRPDSPLRTSEVVVFDWVPGVLRDLTRAGFGIAIASNQPAWAKGKTTRADLQASVGGFEQHRLQIPCLFADTDQLDRDFRQDRTRGKA